MQPGAGSPDVSKVWFTIAKMPRPRFMIYDLGYPKSNSQQRYQVSAKGSKKTNKDQKTKSRDQKKNK
jgi:hypothetical protein